MAGLASACVWGEVHGQHNYSDINPFIVGGTVAKHTYPWVGATRFDLNGETQCGSSLIAEKWVLLAAHCYVWVLKPDYVVFGEYETGKTNNAHYLVRRVKRIIKHPNYNKPTKSSNDIALLELETPVKSITPVNIKDAAKYEQDGTETELVGWGRLSEKGSVSKKLMHVVLPTVDNKKCILPSAVKGRLQDTNICAGYKEGGKDACAGDSGGPLFFTPTGKAPVQTGLVSWGVGCARPNSMGVYTRVSSYIAWI
eukprot:CAMPEP_0203793338 /NCGR_PEP_ID=MMETSP0100_2-20121128/5801_1 /ASSEMBLY_ACC=CAM_ASM_000210 /TAXON_ID=96639 /ORGANISM=" , Strain NY0313808BC1" /LENGTH=253 /DNA_ID=CAMNT_0050697089 /DNA_START=332 /DNA_END=1090 /DNA_ORIENTATION=+